MHATGRFLWNNAGFAPLLLYLAWVPFILLSAGGWMHLPTALLGGEGLTGVVTWFRWAIPFVFNLWPYFSDFILSSTFWVLGVPMLSLVTVRAQTPLEGRCLHSPFPPPTHQMRERERETPFFFFPPSLRLPIPP